MIAKILCAIRSPSERPITERARTRLAGYLPTLDGWRAIAILIVVAAHAVDSIIMRFGSMAVWLRPLSYYGGIGVNIFFGISGLLITTRLLQGSNAKGRFSLRSFYIRRVFRILPPFLLMLGTLSILALLALTPVSATQFCRALFLASNYGPEPNWYLAHTWSLSLEEHFYLFWPVCLLLLTPRRAIPFAVILCIAISVWRFIDIHYQVVPVTVGLVSWRTDAQLDCILWAAALACILHEGKFGACLARLLSPGLTYLVLLLFCSSIIASVIWPRFQHPVRFCQPILISLTLAGSVLNSRALLAKLLEFTFLRWVGRISYSLYLWQQIFFAPVVEHSQAMKTLQSFPWNVGAAFMFAMASYYVVEKPAISLGRRVALRGKELRRAEAIDEIRAANI